MPWTKKNFPDSMKNFDEPVKDKAIEIANSLVEDGYNDTRAISLAISQAQEWYENRGGEVSTHITHHLVPHEGGWILKPVEGNENIVFHTKEEAMSTIKEMLKKEAIKVMVHDSEGRFQKVF
jgi:uncharacterized protein YdaT